MSNQIMVAAITEIDDKLITDAENAGRKRKSFRTIYGVCALAACLVLVFTFAFSFRKNTPVATAPDTQLLIDGSVIGDSPAYLNIPALAQARDVRQDICLNLSLKISENTHITVSHGTMDICSSENTDVIHSGTEYSTSNPVDIHWILYGTDINSVYTLTLNDDIVYSLSYDDTSSQWSICKQ